MTQDSKQEITVETDATKRPTAEETENESPAKKQKIESDNGVDEHPLYSFPSLKKIVDDTSKSNLVALYFSALWCSDSRASSEDVAAVFTDTQDCDIVYISSDKTLEDFESNVKEGYHSIPFENKEELAAIKRKYGCCASKEREGLGMTVEQRKHGIPTLIVIDKASGKVITESGIDDVAGDKKVDHPVLKWKTDSLPTRS